MEPSTSAREGAALPGLTKVRQFKNERTGRWALPKLLPFAFGVALLLTATAASAETFKAKVVEPLSGEVSCKWVRDWLVTLVSGPCEDFKPPTTVRVGETFQANGKIRTIEVIFADRIEKNMPELNLRAGDWTCVAAETVSDIPVMSGKKDHAGTWLYIAKCRPLE